MIRKKGRGITFNSGGIDDGIKFLVGRGLFRSKNARVKSEVTFGPWADYFVFGGMATHTSGQGKGVALGGISETDVFKARLEKPHVPTGVVGRLKVKMSCRGRGN